MWPRGRGSQSQGRGAGFCGNYSPNYPLILGFNQYPQPQGPQIGIWGQHGGYAQPNKLPKRDRLRRPHRDHSPNSSNTVGSRGKSSAGTGIRNAAMSNLPRRPPSSNYREAESRLYFCPKCGEKYSYRHTQNKFIGKIPLILHCNHTMCQECIYQNLKDYKVGCPTCRTDSILTQEEIPVCQTDMQNIFPLNHYIIGVILCYRSSGGYLGNLNNMKFVSTASKKPPGFVDPSDTCCFATCNKLATMYCPSCEDIYCIDCCTFLHKSSKKLMSHEPVARRKEKFSLMLENCVEHGEMQVEFFCKTCDLTACCYCVLDKHTDHERVPLYHLTETEIDEFKGLKKNAESALREVLHTQRRTARLANFNTGSIKKDVSQFFADYHARIETLEKKMYEELENYKSNNRGLDGVQSSLTELAEQLKQLVAFNTDKIGNKKLNLRGALEKLRDIDNIPRCLLNDSHTSEPVRFVVNKTSIDALDNSCVIEKCEDSEYRLVCVKDLPEDYVVDIDESDNEVEGNISAIIGQLNQSEDLVGPLRKTDDSLKMVAVSATDSRRVQRHTKPVEPKRNKLDVQRVEVQHINSMDSFFIQYKHNQSRLAQLNKEIEDYVQMGGAEPVKQLQLNDLCLALYVTESQNQKEQRWCRARLTGIKDSESESIYEMFFLDYGKTQTVDEKRIRDIPPFLVQKKPFAVECMLHNPMNVNWNKKAHFSLAKILNGKDVYMMVKALNCGVHEVDLMIASSDGGTTSVTDILVHAHQSVDPRGDDNASLDCSVTLRRDGFNSTLRVFPNSNKFVKGQKEKVTIANVVDPYYIFVQLVKHQEAFKKMTHAIKRFYKNAKANGCIPIEGTYVLVEYKDAVRSNWHRAFIKTVDLNTDKVHVLLVDWGINVVVSSSSIKPLQESFTKLESQAVLVKLAHIAPYNAQTTWSPHATSYLKTFHQGQDVLKMLVQDIENEISVVLFDVTSKVDLCINTWMVENNLADSIGPISTKLEWPQFEITNPTSSEEDGFVASMVKKMDEEADADSEEDDCAQVKKRQVDVVKVETPDLIWVKFLEFRDRESAMFKDLQIHYSQEQITKNSWAVGEHCVVEIEHEFGRGKILEEINGGFKVYLYDKVQEITVPLDKLYVYDKYFMKYPQTVYKSHLANIRPAGDSGKWSKSSVEALQEIMEKHKRIYGNKALESNEDLSQKSLPLDMWYSHVIRGGPFDPDRLKYVSINNILVKLGFAYKISRPIAQQPLVLTSSTSASLPVQPGTSSGDYLLQVLAGETGKSSEDKTLPERLLPEKSQGHDSLLEASESESVKSGDETLLKSPKTKNTSDDDCPIKNWNTLVEEELGAPAGEVIDQSNKSAKSGDESDDNEGSSYHKTEVELDDWLPSLRLTKNKFRGRVTCVETRGHMYVHEESMDVVYYKMEANIKEYFNENPPEVSDRKWAPGDLCTIKYTDGNWYRGKVLRVKSPEEISVFMIDFGSDHNVSPSVLFRELLYADIRAFATKVKLDKVYSKSGSWLSSDYDHFHELVTDWCQIIVNGPLDVELPLVEVYNGNGILVNQKLLELCPNLSRCSNFPVAHEIDEDDVFIECVESEDEMLLECSSSTIDESQLEYKKRPFPEDLLAGKKVLLEIGGISGYDKVVLKTPGDSLPEDMYNLIVDLQDAADSLPLLKDIKVDMPCLAPYSEDGVWYRARISDTQAVDSGFVDVLFVDYGNSESVSVENLKQISPAYLTVPQQTWEAALNITSTDDHVMDIMQVIKKLDGQTRYFRLVNEDPPTIDIYNEDNELLYKPFMEIGTIKPLLQREDV